MQDRPTKIELLGMIESLLGEDVYPTAEGRVRFHLLVAMNLLGIVQREIALEEEHANAEHAGLCGLLEDPPATPAGGAAELAERVRRGNERLCREIREGAASTLQGDSALYRHLRTTLENKLAVANPRFLARVLEEEE